MATQARGLNGSRRLTNQIREQLLAVEVAVCLVKCSWSASQRSWESFFFNHPKPKSPPEGWLTWPNYFLFFVQRSTIFICRMGMVGGADEYFLLPIRVSPWSCLSAIRVAWALWNATWATTQMLNQLGAVCKLLCGYPWSCFLGFSRFSFLVVWTFFLIN